MYRSAPTAARAAIDLYWLPLGAGGRSVRGNGRVFEAIVARRAGRPAAELFHSALVVSEHGRRFVIEMAPAWGSAAGDRGVVVVGPVGARPLGRSRLFRYEVRRWPDGRIPDVGEAVASPWAVPSDAARVAVLLDLVPCVPPLVWGRDESGTGEMWNSNSLTSWLLSSAGHDMVAIHPPPGGRAPGWHAGLALAASRDQAAAVIP